MAGHSILIRCLTRGRAHIRGVAEDEVLDAVPAPAPAPEPIPAPVPEPIPVPAPVQHFRIRNPRAIRRGRSPSPELIAQLQLDLGPEPELEPEPQLEPELEPELRFGVAGGVAGALALARALTRANELAREPAPVVPVAQPVLVALAVPELHPRPTGPSFEFAGTNAVSVTTTAADTAAISAFIRSQRATPARKRGDRTMAVAALLGIPASDPIPKIRDRKSMTSRLAAALVRGELGALEGAASLTLASARDAFAGESVVDLAGVEYGVRIVLLRARRGECTIMESVLQVARGAELARREHNWDRAAKLAGFAGALLATQGEAERKLGTATIDCDVEIGPSVRRAVSDAALVAPPARRGRRQDCATPESLAVAIMAGDCDSACDYLDRLGVGAALTPLVAEAIVAVENSASGAFFRVAHVLKSWGIDRAAVEMVIRLRDKYKI